MRVWGVSECGGRAVSGVLYIPSSDSWEPMTTSGAPFPRLGHTAVWTGSRMLVWGGEDASGKTNTGGLYDPATDTWTATTTIDAPIARAGHAAVWMGSRLLVWGGDAQVLGHLTTTGGQYDPATDSWSPTTTDGAPPA